MISTKLSTFSGVDTVGLWFCWHCATLLFATVAGTGGLGAAAG